MDHTESTVWETYSTFKAEGAGADAALLTLAAMILEHAKATRAIAHGDVSGPSGLEGLAMAIAGAGLGTPLAQSLSGIADSVSEIATVLEASNDA